MCCPTLIAEGRMTKNSITAVFTDVNTAHWGPIPAYKDASNRKRVIVCRQLLGFAS